MNTPIKYFGGKSSMFNKIIEQFPEKGTYDTYIEPFGGSFAIGFHTPEDRIAPIEIYNDLENNVWSLFEVLTDNDKFKEFKRLCDLSYYDEYMRRRFKNELTSDNLSDVERAFRFFYVNRSSHNGIGGFSMNRVIRRGMAKSVSDYLSTVDRLQDIHQRLSKVLVFHRDGIKIMKDYNYSHAFIYCDPPYDLSTRTDTRYALDMDNEQQDEFLETCINSHAKILVSGYDCERYNKLTDNGFIKISFEVNTISGAYKPKVKTETLWKNY